MTDLHVHTSFCDGKNTPEELVVAAIGAGITRLGLVAHSYVPFDENSCIGRDENTHFQHEVAVLRTRYADRIELLCGVEQDVYSPAPTEGYDFVIGSVHYLRCAGEYYAVDDTEEALRAALTDRFGGDGYALAEDYYKTVSALDGVDVIGHFDLITKLNRDGRFFDETKDRYRAAWQAAADRLLRTGIPFEINTGGIFRGYRTDAYPSAEIRAYLRERGAKFVLSSDAHCVEALGFELDRFEEYEAR